MSSATEVDIKKLITVPAIITFVVTLARLFAELGNLPSWLANKDAGGAGAVIGITWLAPIFAIYFAIKLVGAPGALWKNLMKTLVAYGLAARIPVIIIMGLAIFGNWGTHYDAISPQMPDATPMTRFLVGGVATQLVAWIGFWTVGIGTIVGLVGAKLLGPKKQAARA